jgi:hypothetical protein
MKQVVCPKCHSGRVSAILEDTGGVLAGSSVFTDTVVDIVCLQCGNHFRPGYGIVKTTDEKGNEKIVNPKKEALRKEKTGVIAVMVIVLFIILLVMRYNWLVSH